jgi:hypothetical protein
MRHTLLSCLIVCALLAIGTVHLTTRAASNPQATTPAQALEPSNNLPVSTATFLGGAQDDARYLVDVALDGTLVYAGTLTGQLAGGATPVDLLGGGDGAVLRLSREGTSVLSLTRIGNAINDLEIDGSGRIAVCGDFGVAVLSADASSVVWNASPGDVKRCSSGTDGTVAVLVGDTVTVYGSDGTPAGSWQVAGTSAQNIAVDGSNNIVIVSGYTQKSSNLQVAYIRGWRYDGTQIWTSYNFSADAIGAANLGADTRGEVVAIGRDGKLYFAGSINGGTGASIFARDPKNINEQSTRVETDNYNRPTNVGSVKMTWYGRYNPVDGSLETGQSVLTRLSSGRGNSISVNEITADASGRMFLSGGTSCCIQNRDERQVGGVTVGGYSGGEAFFLAVSADFQQRLIWTPFTAPGASGGGSPSTGVAVRDGVAAVAIRLEPDSDQQRDLITTSNALLGEPAGLPAAYLAVWPFANQTTPAPTTGPTTQPTPAPTATLQPGITPGPSEPVGEPQVWIPFIASNPVIIAPYPDPAQQ